jgi:dTDP-4-dehydrorhamnose reductase
VSRARLMVTGASGLLGSALLPVLSQGWEVYPFGYRSLPDHERAGRLDLKDVDAVSAALGRIEPDVVLNLVALTNVDRCEQEPCLAYELNVATVMSLATAVVAAARVPKVVHISTDQVYDREGANRVDSVRPSNVYALTKLWAEDALLARLPEALVLRTNFVCVGERSRPGFGGWLLDRLRSGAPFQLFSDVFFNPVHARVLPDMLRQFTELDGHGVYNVGLSGGGVSKAQFGRRLARRAGYGTNHATDVSVSDANLRAYRPRGMVMDVTETERFLGQKMESLEDCLDALVDEWSE